VVISTAPHAFKEIIMNRIRLFSCLGILFFGPLLFNSTCSAQTTAEPIPAGFDFPADEAALIQLRDDEDVTKMRLHAWMVYAGMTQPAPGGEAIWETWHPSHLTFAPDGPGPLTPQPARVFAPPRQHEGVPGPLAPGESLMSFVMFNQEAHDFIRTNKFYKQPTLNSLLAALTPTTPIEDRKVEDFPAKAMSLKTTWWRINKSGITPMPIWDFDPANPDSAGNDFPTWKRIVGIDPTRQTVPAGETAQLRFPQSTSPQRTAKVYPLNKLYHFEVTAANVDSFTNFPANSRPVVGDFVALVGFHYTTKEIPDWVWATFWWHDAPDTGLYAADRPSQVAGVWKHYLMDAAYSMDTPKESDGKPNAVYNPWLEARFPNGMVSNCMTCHQRAVWPGVPFLPVTRGAMPADDPFFATRMKTDFMWSMVFESKP
jgi:hypothetical protein